jgi:hypothetical protein
VDHQLVGGHRTGDLAGQVDAAGPGHAGPGVRCAPRLGEFGERLAQVLAPAGADVRRGPSGVGVGGAAQVLARGVAEGGGQTGQVAEQVADRQVRARGRVVEPPLGHALGEVGEHQGLRGEVEGGGAVGHLLLLGDAGRLRAAL